MLTEIWGSTHTRASWGNKT